jgi:hypothetical protein
VFSSFPDIRPCLGGTSSVFVANLLGDLNAVPPHTLIPEMFGVRNATWNVAFIGDAWADFGWFGILSQSLMLGVFLQWTNLWFASRVTSAFAMAVYVSLIVTAHKFAQASLLSTLIGFGVIPLIALYVICNNWKSKQRSLVFSH